MKKLTLVVLAILVLPPVGLIAWQLGSRMLNIAGVPVGAQGAVDTELLDVAVLGDNTANPTITGIASYTMCYDGSTWDRCNTGAADTTSLSTIAGDTTDIEASIELLNPKLPTAATITDNFANPSTTGVMAYQMCWDGSAWDRCTGAGVDTELLSVAALADNTANPTITGIAAYMMCFDGTTWDRCPSGDGGGGVVTSNSSRVVMGSGVGCYINSSASTHATNCKSSAGRFYGVRMVNTTATLYYLRMYNLATTPTCSSATGFIESIPVPASTTGAGIVAISSIPIAYASGIGFCFTGGPGGADNTNAAAGVYGAVVYE